MDAHYEYGQSLTVDAADTLLFDFSIDKFMRQLGVEEEHICDIDPSGQTVVTTNSERWMGHCDGHKYKNEEAMTNAEPAMAKHLDGNKAKRKRVPDELKDEKYWIMRKKNTEATRRCRELKKTKQQEIIQSYSELEKEFKSLKMKVEIIKEKYKKLKAKNRVLHMIIDNILSAGQGD